MKSTIYITGQTVLHHSIVIGLYSTPSLIMKPCLAAPQHGTFTKAGTERTFAMALVGL